MSLMLIAVVAAVSGVGGVCIFTLAVWLLSRAEIDEARRISQIRPTRMDDVDGLDLFDDFE